MKKLAELFLTFAKIGVATFGGGYAMIGIIEGVCVEQKKWLTHEEMMDVAVIAESTPGPIAINCATYAGFVRDGLPGAAAATLGVVLPSFTIIYLISMFLEHFLEIRIIASAFMGIKLCVALLIVNAGINMLKKMKKKKLSLVLLSAGFLMMLGALLFGVKLSSIVLMVGAGVVSLTLSCVKRGGNA